MNLSFSTLGCPGWSWDEIITTAKDLALQGVEIRGLGNEIDAVKLSIFKKDVINKTMTQLDKLKMSIPILTSGCALGEEDAQADLEKAKEYIDLAQTINTPYIRVMITSHPESTYGDFETGAKLYEELCEYAKDKNVTPLVETNGLLANSNEMRNFMCKVDSENKGVVWDIHHPARYFFEDPEMTCENIGKHIKHVQVKDSIVKDGKIRYRIMGYGDIPINEAVNCLKNLDYTGFISLEWVKRWDPTLEEPGIVFAHFKYYMDNMIR